MGRSDLGDEPNKRISMFLGFIALLAIIIGSISTVACTETSTASPEKVYVGSTPGGAVVKTMLDIDPGKPVDFIRWHLVLREQEKAFVMSIHYGVGKPNTPDFEGGGEKRTFLGTYTVYKEGPREIYTLKTSKMTQPVSLIKLNDDFFHVLTPDKRLMVGTGGWSYSLSRKHASSTRSTALTTFEPAGSASPQVVFDGRTPCQEIAKEYQWNAGDECFKLKWRLTLYRDPKTGKPTTYSIQKTLHRTEPIEGSWIEVTGTKKDPKALIFKLDPDRPDTSLSFLVGDENVLFFLDKENRLFGGNADFSYTLNRRLD